MKNSVIAKNLLKLREKGFASYSKWKALFFVAYLVLCAVFYYVGVYRTLITLFTGYAIGLFVRDILLFTATKKSWPIAERIINWSEVEKIADEKDS